MANLTHNLNTFEEVIQIRKLVASIFWQLKKDYKQLWSDDDFAELNHYLNKKEVYYDVGMIVGYLRSLNKDKLAEKVYDKFMDN